jgi:hypothetical protein
MPPPGHSFNASRRDFASGLMSRRSDIRLAPPISAPCRIVPVHSARGLAMTLPRAVTLTLPPPLWRMHLSQISPRVGSSCGLITRLQHQVDQKMQSRAPRVSPAEAQHSGDTP